MKRIDNVFTYTVTYFDTDFDTIEVLNRSYGYCEFDSSFELDKSTYIYNQEQIKLGNDTYLDLYNLFSKSPEKLELLITDKIDLIIIKAF